MTVGGRRGESDVALDGFREQSSKRRPSSDDVRRTVLSWRGRGRRVERGRQGSRDLRNRNSREKREEREQLISLPSRRHTTMKRDSLQAVSLGRLWGVRRRGREGEVGLQQPFNRPFDAGGCVCLDSGAGRRTAVVGDREEGVVGDGPSGNTPAPSRTSNQPAVAPTGNPRPASATDNVLDSTLAPASESGRVCRRNCLHLPFKICCIMGLFPTFYCLSCTTIVCMFFLPTSAVCALGHARCNAAAKSLEESPTTIVPPSL
jgi:hypothetical protein